MQHYVNSALPVNGVCPARVPKLPFPQLFCIFVLKVEFNTDEQKTSTGATGFSKNHRE